MRLNKNYYIGTTHGMKVFSFTMANREAQIKCRDASSLYIEACDHFTIRDKSVLQRLRARSKSAPGITARPASEIRGIELDKNRAGLLVLFYDRNEVAAGRLWLVDERGLRLFPADSIIERRH